MNPHLIIIGGPTASGKTRLACELARKYSLDILSADSRQVYRGLDIGTGKDLQIYTEGATPVPVYMIDVADPVNIYSLYHYQKDCYQQIKKSAKKSPVMLMVGGTGLYIEAILKKYQLSTIKEYPEYRKMKMLLPTEDLILELKSKNSELFAKTDHSSKKRIVRALEILEFSDGTPHLHTTPELNFTYDIFCLDIPRPELYKNISDRLETRLDEGMVNEVRLLLENGISPERLAMLGLEYKIISQYLIKEQPYNEMKEILAREIRRTAKGQLTWFRGMERRGLKVNWIKSTSSQEIENCLQNHLKTM